MSHHKDHKEIDLVDEKHGETAEHLEHVQYSDNDVHTDTETGHKNIDYGFEPAQVKRIMRKVDLRLMPIMAALYTVSGKEYVGLTLSRFRLWTVPTWRTPVWLMRT